MASATYKHKPLSAGKTIRVLDVHPSKKFDAPIQCSLRDISLEGDREPSNSYEALSYVWGSPSGDQPISCKGETLLVTPNCLSALRHFRYKSRSRTLWIDSISIDQNSNLEKNHQVKLMGSVYKLASRVLVWLGAGNPAISSSFRKFKLLALYLRGLTSLSATFPHLKRYLKKKPNRRRVLSLALRGLVENEWFHRVWTAQELCLAVTPIIFCGSKYLSWADLKLCAFYYMTDLMAAFSTSSNPLLDSCFIRDCCYYTRQYERGVDTPHLNGYDWFEILNSTRRRKASNPRDYLYAIYGLCPDLVARFGLPEIDYQISVASLYEEATFCIIQSTRLLEALNWVPIGQRTAGLPSWVPDYSRFHEVSFQMDDIDLENNLKNSQPIPSQIHLERRPGELRLPGRIWGKVEAISAERMPFRLNTTRDRNYFSIALLGWYKFRRTRRQSQNGRSESLDYFRFFRTIACPHRPDEIVTPSRIESYTQLLPKLEELLNEANRLWGLEPGFIDLDKSDISDLIYEANESRNRMQLSELQDVLAHLAYKLKTKCLFATSDGFWGLSVADVELGDTIVLFPGAATPMIVRSKPDGENKFQLVGPALIPTILQETWDSVYRLEDVEPMILI